MGIIVGQIPMTLENLPTKLRSAELLGKDTTPETHLTVWQWYWVNGKLSSSDFEAKFYTALARLSGQGDDSAIVMLYTPSEHAAATLPAFAEEASPAINQLLANTRAAR